MNDITLKIVFYIICALFLPGVLYVLIKKDKTYGNPKIAFWNLAYFLSWFIAALPVYFRLQIINFSVWLITGLGQFVLMASLARHFINKEKKRINK